MRRNTWVFLLLFSPSALGAVSFKDALQRILEKNIEIQAQEAGGDALSSQVLPQRLGFLPTLSGTISQDYSSLTSDATRTYGVSTSLNVFHFGADWANLKKAGYQIDTEEYRLQQVRLEIEKRGAQVYFETLEKKLSLKRKWDDLQIKKESFKIAKERFQKGLLPKQEVDKIEVDLENAQNTFQRNTLSLIESQNALHALLGEREVEERWPWKEKLSSQALKPLLDESRRTQAYVHRPDYLAAESQVEVASYTRKNSLGLMLPSLDLTASYGTTQNLTTSAFTPAWSVGVSVSIPLFDRLTQYGTFRSAVHLEKQAELEKERVRRDAVQEIQDIQAAIQTALDTVERSERILKTVRKLHKLTLTRFRQGRASVNDLALDEARLIEAELNGISNWKNLHFSAIRLCHSLGKSIQKCFD